jgi:iron complex outermembrane receptor protein
MINSDVLERVEVIKGPSSALYGAGLGGTIRLKTKLPVQEGIKAGARFSAGSWNFYSGAADISLKRKNTSLKISGRTMETDAFRENNHYKRNDMFLGFGQQTEKINLRALINFNEFTAGIPSSLNREDYLENPEKAADSWAEVEGYEDVRNLMGGLSLEYSFNQRFRSKTVVFSGLNELFESRPFNIFDSWQYRLGARQSVDLLLSNVDLKAGFETIFESTDWEIFQTLSGQPGDKLNALKDRRSYFSAFLHSEILLVPGLRLEPGLSVTWLNYNLNDQFDNSEDLSGNYHYEPAVSPRLGLNYRAWENLYLYASAGHGFSAPSLEETLLPEGESNTELKPESGWTFDGGVRGSKLEGRL